MFKEKPTAVEILLMLKQFDTNKIIPNAFLVVYTKEAFLKQIEYYGRKTEDGRRLAEYGGSYFQAVIQSQFDPSVLNKVEDANEETTELFKDITNNVLPKDKIIVASLGTSGRFTDRGNGDLMSRAYFDAIDAERNKGERGIIKKQVKIGDKVTLKIDPQDLAILQNVEITSDKLVTLEFKDNVYIQNSKIHLSGDMVLHEKR